MTSFPGSNGHAEPLTDHAAADIRAQQQIHRVKDSLMSKQGPNGASDDLDRILRKLGVLQGFSALIEREISAASTGNMLIAAQRLWSILFAAAGGLSYGDLIPADRKNLIRHFCQSAHELIVERLRPIDRAVAQPHACPRRFLVSVNYLPPSNQFGSHTHQICCFATALASLPDTEEILVLVSGETMPEGNKLSRAHSESFAEAAWGWRAILASVATDAAAAKIRFHHTEPVGVVHPIEATLATALAFEADVNLYFLGILRTHLLPPLLFAFAPQIGIQFNVGNAEPAYCDLVLSHGGGSDFGTKPNPHLWASQPVPKIPIRPSHAKAASLPAGFVLPPADLRIVTVLGFGRIERLLAARPDLADRIAAFLTCHAGVVWLLVGVESPKRLAPRSPAWQRMVEAGRITIMRPTPHLRELYGHCHLYAHLPGLGGGAGAIGMAVEENLPALVERGTDATNFIADEGVYDDIEGLMFRLRDLVADSRMRADLAGRQARAIARNHSIEAVARSLAAHFPTAARRFAERMTQRA